MADAEVLYLEYEQAVFRYLCRVVGQAEMARDLTQEVFLRAHRAGVPDSDAASLRGWVFSIARNLALTHHRDTRRHVVVPEVTTAGPAVQELAVAIERALAALDNLDRDVFLLRETGGLSYLEVATTCGLSVDGVRARLRRTRETLRDALDGSLRVHRRPPISFTGDEG